MASGGYRPNSGPQKGAKYKKRVKKTAKTTKKAKKSDIPSDIAGEAKALNLKPLDYMLGVMNNAEAEEARRDRMAIAAAPFVHGRVGGSKGKKEQREDKAKKAGSGRFKPSEPPILKAVK